MNVDSETLFYAYFVGAAVTLGIGIWLSHRSRIGFPVLLEFFIASEWTMLPFVLFWPILGPAVFAEILLRGWYRRRSQQGDASVPTSPASIDRGHKPEHTQKNN